MASARDLLAEAQIDRELVSLKISQARKSFGEKLQQRFRDDSSTLSEDPFAQIQRVYAQGAGEWAEVVFRIYAEVWQKQGNPQTPDFLRVVLTRGVIPEIEKIILQGKCAIENLAQISPVSPNVSSLALRKLAHDADNLWTKWRTRIEIEARELELARRSLPSNPPAHLGTLPGSRQRTQGIAAGAMTAEEFWRDLEARFRALHTEQIRGSSNDLLQAQWSSLADPDDGTPWSLSGGSARIRALFEWLAQSAAVRLGHSGGPSAVFAWLDRLKAESPHYKGGITGTLYEPKVSPKKVRTESGLIVLLCLASAEYCLKCETDEKTHTRNALDPIEKLSSLMAAQVAGLPPQKLSSLARRDAFLGGTAKEREMQRKVAELDKKVQKMETVIEERQKPSQPDKPIATFTDRDPEIVKRRVIVGQNPEVSSQGMCTIFDNEKVPLPTGWAVPSWPKAYQSKVYRSRIHVIVSKDRKHHG